MNPKMLESLKHVAEDVYETKGKSYCSLCRVVTKAEIHDTDQASTEIQQAYFQAQLSFHGIFSQVITSSKALGITFNSDSLKEERTAFITEILLGLLFGEESDERIGIETEWAKFAYLKLEQVKAQLDSMRRATSLFTPDKGNSGIIIPGTGTTLI